ncbi:MAG: aldose epimerase family protein [Ornithinibacter sp.]
MLVRSSFGALDDGADVTAYTLGADERGLQLTVLDLGATIARVRMPLPDGGFVDVALGLAAAGDYAAPTNPYLGSTVGRYANRIGDATFILDGVRHDLAPNEGTTCLHGGPGGFHSRQWSLVASDDTSLELQLVSADGDQGFPGEVTARVRYSVTADSITIEHVAETSAATVVSLTNHAYLNLAGEGTIDEHRLTVAADAYLPVDERSIPLGHVEPVQDTPFDLRHGAVLGERVGADHPQVRQAGGLDHALVLGGDALRPVARLEHPPTGRSLEVSTTQPSVQVYTGQQLDGTVVDRGGRVLEPRAGVALECQAYPDAPNQPAFPSAVLRPGEEYRATTVWRFAQH